MSSSKHFKHRKRRKSKRKNCFQLWYVTLWSFLLYFFVLSSHLSQFNLECFFLLCLRLTSASELLEVTYKAASMCVCSDVNSVNKLIIKCTKEKYSNFLLSSSRSSINFFGIWAHQTDGMSGNLREKIWKLFLWKAFWSLHFSSRRFFGFVGKN